MQSPLEMPTTQIARPGPLVLEEIPPPVRSDGNMAMFPIAGPKIIECEASRLALFLLPLREAMKDAYKNHPEMMSNFNMEKAVADGYLYAKDATMKKLPKFYKSYQNTDTGEVLIFGHPSGLSYTSAADLLPHLHWLINDPSGPHSHCACKLCPVFVNRFFNNRPAAPAAYLPIPRPNLPISTFPPKVEPFVKALAAASYKTEIRARVDDVINPILEPPRPTKKPRLGSSDDKKYEEKYKALKRRVHDVVSEVESLSSLLSKSKARIEKLKSERKYLYRKIEDMQKSSPEKFAHPQTDSEMSIFGSDSELSMFSETEMDPTALSAPQLSAKANTSPLTSNPVTPITAKPKKKRALADPNAPKRPANAFMLFCDMERSQVKKERDDLKEQMPGSEEDAGLGNITKALGNRWKALNDTERMKYTLAFREEVKKYNLAMAEYKEKNGDPVKNAAANKGKSGNSTPIKAAESPMSAPTTMPAPAMLSAATPPLSQPHLPGNIPNASAIHGARMAPAQPTHANLAAIRPAPPSIGSHQLTNIAPKSIISPTTSGIPQFPNQFSSRPQQTNISTFSSMNTQMSGSDPNTDIPTNKQQQPFFQLAPMSPNNGPPVTRALQGDNFVLPQVSSLLQGNRNLSMDEDDVLME